MTEKEPYRSAEPCGICEERKKRLEKMQPFSKDAKCPACLSNDTYFYYKYVCSGNNHRFLEKRGFWFFGWRGRVVWTCQKNYATHFHLRCEKCHYTWEMVSALEKP